VFAAELWDPDTGKWTVLASMKVPRMYHSTAMLLPDGRVITSGGGQPEGTGEAKGTIHDDMQIFSPPYLYRGARPTITSAPSAATYGQTINVATPDAASISKVTLLRLGSVTHGFNFTQRIAKLSFEKSEGGLTVQLPTNPNSAPPGPYMLFVINDQGVPSVASMISLN
jgi:hypothetical protein